MRNTRSVAVTLLVITTGMAGACGDDGPDFDILPNCGEWSKRAVAEQELEDGCTGWGDRNERDEPTRVTYVPERWRCEDGRTLFWTESAWGYVGEPWDVVTLHGSQVPPPHAARSCRPDDDP